MTDVAGRAAVVRFVPEHRAGVFPRVPAFDIKIARAVQDDGPVNRAVSAVVFDRRPAVGRLKADVFAAPHPGCQPVALYHRPFLPPYPVPATTPLPEPRQEESAGEKRER